MSITFDWIINPIVMVIASISGVIVGLAVAKAKLMQLRAKMMKLETDLLSSNHETLEAQRALADLESRMKDQAIPVIPMKISGTKDNSKEKATK